MSESTNVKPDYRVLIVEDNVDVVKTLTTLLESSFLIESYGTATEAIARLGRKPEVHGVLLDLKLPNGEGVRLIQRFQQSHPEIPLVVISGYNYSMDRMLLAGAQDFLRKPCVAEDVKESLVKSIVRHVVRGIFKDATEQVAPLKEQLGQSVQAINAALESPRLVDRISKPPSDAK